MAIETRKDDKGREYQFDTELGGPVLMVRDNKDAEISISEKHLETVDEAVAKETARAEREAKKAEKKDATPAHT